MQSSAGNQGCTRADWRSPRRAGIRRRPGRHRRTQRHVREWNRGTGTSRPSADRPPNPRCVPQTSHVRPRQRMAVDGQELIGLIVVGRLRKPPGMVGGTTSVPRSPPDPLMSASMRAGDDDADGRTRCYPCREPSLTAGPKRDPGGDRALPAPRPIAPATPAPNWLSNQASRMLPVSLIRNPLPRSSVVARDDVSAGCHQRMALATTRRGITFDGWAGR